MKIGNDVGCLTKVEIKNNNDTLEATEADVGCEKTHYQNRKVDPET